MWSVAWIGNSSSDGFKLNSSLELCGQGFVLEIRAVDDWGEWHPGPQEARAEGEKLQHQAGLNRSTGSSRQTGGHSRTWSDRRRSSMALKQMEPWQRGSLQ